MSRPAATPHSVPLAGSSPTSARGTIKRGRGRPRNNQRPRDGTPAEEILHAAARLFAAKGFDGTSTRAIAEAAGLRQPSLFHHFDSKEAILRALAERSLARPLEVLERIARTDASPAVKLYRVLDFQVRHFCSQSLDLTAVLTDATRLGRRRFPRLFDDAARYTHKMRALVEQGIASGEFVETDSVTAANGLLGMANWTIRWFNPGGRLSADELASHLAHLAVRSLLRDPSRLDHVIAEATAQRA